MRCASGWLLSQRRHCGRERAALRPPAGFSANGDIAVADERPCGRRLAFQPAATFRSRTGVLAAEASGDIAVATLAALQPTADLAAMCDLTVV